MSDKRVIYFDWDSGQWMVIGNNGDTHVWNGMPDDAAETETNFLPSGIKEPSPWGCIHDWGLYDSGITAYEYCKICDQKRSL